MPPGAPTPRVLGRHSAARYFLVHGLALAGAGALIVAFRTTGVPGARPVLATAVSGLSILAGTPVQPRAVEAAPSAAALPGDCSPFACASGPTSKWASAPAPDPAAPPCRPPEVLVVRSDLTGEPYPVPDKPPLSSAAPVRRAITASR